MTQPLKIQHEKQQRQPSLNVALSKLGKCIMQQSYKLSTSTTAPYSRALVGELATFLFPYWLIDLGH